jgi:tetratricopeptide (TPR) repeat protein
MTWRDAPTLWTDALRKSSANPLAHYNLGVNLAEAGLTARAAREYAKAIREQPDYMKARVNLANLLVDRGDLAEGIAALDEAARRFPGEFSVHYNLGRALQMQGKVERSVAEYEAALRIDPTQADAHIALGQLYAERLAMPAKAVLHWRRALELAPHHEYAERVRQWIEKLKKEP